MPDPHGGEDRDTAPGGEGIELSPELRAATRAFTLKLPSFEGPLDLLLHLIREHKLDIFDIPISFVTDEYLSYLGRMKELNLDVAGEFLVMAATLAHIKSRMLLPRPDPLAEEEEEPGDPRAELVRRLLEYQKYRAAAADLARQDLLGRDVFTRTARPFVPAPEGTGAVKEVSVFKLIEALDQVLRNLQPEKQHEVMLDRTSVTAEIHRIMERLRPGGETTFFSLFEGLQHRHRVIATFLGLLELTRLKLVRIVQDGADQDIRILATDRLGAADVEVRDDFR